MAVVPWNMASLKIGGTEVITSGRVLQNIASAAIAGTLTVEGLLRVAAATSAPAAATGYSIIFTDAADGDLKVRFSNGTVQTLATN